jgi:hypothetical protein
MDFSGNSFMGEEIVRRQPARELKVSELSQEDGLAALTGRLKELKEKEAVLEDESGQVKLSFPEEKAENLKEGGLVRVIGRRLLNDNETRFNVEAVHDMAGLDLALYQKVKALEQKFGVKK